MHLKTLLSVVAASIFLTACGGGGSNPITKKLTCTQSSTGDIAADCKTETVDLKDGVESLVIIGGTRTETLELSCNGKTVTASTIANYLTGEIAVSASGESAISCKMFFESPLDKTLANQQDVMDLVEWGEDPQDPSYIDSNPLCPDEILNEDPTPTTGDIPPEMIEQCTGYIQADYDFTDNTNEHHKFSIKYTIK